MYLCKHSRLVRDASFETDRYMATSTARAIQKRKESPALQSLSQYFDATPIGLRSADASWTSLAN